MKFFSVIFLIAIFFTQVVQARELTNRESLVLSTYDRTQEVFKYAQENIDESLLSWSEWLQYSLLKRSCRLLDRKIDQIKQADSDYPDQSEALSTRYLACSEGVLSTVRLYMTQRP